MEEKTETDGRKQKGNGRDETRRGTDGRGRTDTREKKGERQLDNERENYRRSNTNYKMFISRSLLTNTGTDEFVAKDLKNKSEIQ